MDLDDRLPPIVADRLRGVACDLDWPRDFIHRKFFLRVEGVAAASGRDRLLPIVADRLMGTLPVLLSGCCGTGDFVFCMMLVTARGRARGESAGIEAREGVTLVRDRLLPTVADRLKGTLAVGTTGAAARVLNGADRLKVALALGPTAADASPRGGDWLKAALAELLSEVGLPSGGDRLNVALAELLVAVGPPSPFDRAKITFAAFLSAVGLLISVDRGKVALAVLRWNVALALLLAEVGLPMATDLWKIALAVPTLPTAADGLKIALAELEGLPGKIALAVGKDRPALLARGGLAFSNRLVPGMEGGECAGSVARGVALVVWDRLLPTVAYRLKFTLSELVLATGMVGLKVALTVVFSVSREGGGFVFAESPLP